MDQVKVTESNKRLTRGMYDAVINGVLLRDIPAKMVYVSSESQLAALTGYRAGTIAATFGFTHMWQLDTSGEWISMTGGD